LLVSGFRFYDFWVGFIVFATFVGYVSLNLKIRVLARFYCVVVIFDFEILFRVFESVSFIFENDIVLNLYYEEVLC
jgi:hypothetical protein